MWDYHLLMSWNISRDVSGDARHFKVLSDMNPRPSFSQPLNVKLHYSEQNNWISPSSLFDGDRAKYTISIQSACLCETSTDSIFPSLVCSVRARSICLPLTVAAREARLSHSLNLRSPCESLYKKFPVVTFVSWKVVVWRSSYQDFFPWASLPPTGRAGNSSGISISVPELSVRFFLNV